MVRRWILYLSIMAGLTVFYWAYQAWFSWFALTGVLFFPLAALLMSLPAMLTFRLKPQLPGHILRGAPGPVTYSVRCPLPAPPYVCRLKLENTLTGECYCLKEGQDLPAEHCGQLLCRPEKARIYDYAGLFWLGIYKKGAAAVLVRPEPVPVRNLPQLERCVAAAWRPKAGGGFSENHELRLYRPGDSLNQIHWKLSAKTKKYIIREPQEPEKSSLLLSLALRGTPEEMDRKLGRLLWLSRHLLERGLSHRIRALTSGGILSLPVADAQELETAIDTLLCAQAAPENAILEDVAALWQYRIGGGEDEGQ